VADHCDETVTLANGETEKRYMCDLVLDTQGEGFNALEEILATFGGYLQYYDGLIHLGVEKNESTDHTFDTSNIISGTFSYHQIEKNGVPNIVRVTFVEPKEDYKQVYIQVESEIDRAEGGERTAELRILGITRASQAQRRANLILWKGLLAEWACQFRVSIKHCHVTAGDVCAVTHTVPGWSAKKFRIVEVYEYSNDEIQLTCTEYIEVTTAIEEDLPETSYYTRTGGQNTLLASAVPSAPTWTLKSIEGGWRLIVTSYVAGTLKYELCKYIGIRDSQEYYKAHATFDETRNSAGDGALVYNVYVPDPSVETYGKFKLRVITAADQSELSAAQGDWSRPDSSLVAVSNLAPTLPAEAGTYPTLTLIQNDSGESTYSIKLKIVAPSGYENLVARYELQRRDNSTNGYGSWEDVGVKIIDKYPAPRIVYWINEDVQFEPGVSYQWRVRARRQDGTASPWSASLTEVVAGHSTAPDKPTLSVTQHPLGLLLTISIPAEGGQPMLAHFSHFKIEGNKGGGWDDLVVGHHSTIFYLHNLVNASMTETWQYRITTYDISGNPSTVSNASTGKSPELLGSSCFQADCITTSHVDFTVAGTGNIIGMINASSEGGGTLNISAAKIAISGSCTFTAGYNPTTKVAATGGQYDSATSGARLRIFPDANTALVAIDNSAADVFKVMVGGADVGDVIIGASAGQHVKWDKSASTLYVEGQLTATGLKTGTDNNRAIFGTLGGYGMIKMYFDGNERLFAGGGLFSFKNISEEIKCQISSLGLWVGFAGVNVDCTGYIKTLDHYKVGTNQVVGARGTAVGDATVATDISSMSLDDGSDHVDRAGFNVTLVTLEVEMGLIVGKVNALVTKFNTLLDKLGTPGHGLTAD